MELFVKCVVVAVICAIAAITLRRHVPEISLILVLITGFLLLGAVSGVLSRVISFLRDLAAAAGIAPDVIAPLFKATAIAILTKIACDVCKESGAGSLASVVELCGCLVAVLLSLPLLTSVMQLVTSFG